MTKFARSVQQWYLVHEETVIGYLFLLPVATILLVLVGYPGIVGIWYSLTNKMIGYTNPSFIGLRNYIELISDPRLIEAIIRSLWFSFAAMVLKLVFGLLVALLINQRFLGRGFVRGAVLLPWAMPSIAAILIWAWMYNDLFGVFNFLLMETGIVNVPINFLGDRRWVMPSIILLNLWRGFPFFTINLLAGLQAIPEELYEVARIDGASAFQSFLHITLPSLRTVILIVCLLSFIWNANIFTDVWVLTRGGPGKASEVFSILTFKLAFQGLELGKAAAVPVLLIPFFSILIVFLNKAVSGEEV
ncbi:MAG: carbohydrate ABC transporter permease [Anaerolineales bacterium]